MPEPFDAVAFLRYLGRRWPLVVTVLLVAAVTASGVTLILPKQYTASARVLIQPSVKGEFSSSTTMSGVYLDSLNTYTHLASSDSLFQKAVEDLQIVDSPEAESLSGLKERVLEVEIPRNTRILEITVTLSDPDKAQALAEYVARETVRLNEDASDETSATQAADLESMLAEARKLVEEAEAEVRRLAINEPTLALTEELESLVERRSLLEGRLAEADEPGPPAARLQGQVERLGNEIDQMAKTLALRQARHDAAQSELELARHSYREAKSRLDEARADLVLRGERLRVVDPGIVPQEPSYPNVALHVVAALLLGFFAALVYLTAEFALLRRKAEPSAQPVRLAHHG